MVRLAEMVEQVIVDQSSLGRCALVGRGSLRCRVGDGDEIGLDVGFGGGGVVKKLQNVEEFVEDARWIS